MGTFTISTHTGSSVAWGHNRRDPKITSKEKHIDPDGVHEEWIDKSARAVYHQLFDEAQKDYNNKQTRDDRKIKDYYSTIEKDDRKHAVYEMIAAVGSKKNPPDPVTGKQILHEFVDGWEKRNPNLVLTGAYYHADEEGVPHVHIDYVPIAHGYKRGMACQSSYNKALGEMGFHGRMSIADWTASENSALETICRAHGLEIDHPEAGDKTIKHYDNEIFKAKEELKNVQAEVEAARAEVISAKAEAKAAEENRWTEERALAAAKGAKLHAETDAKLAQRKAETIPPAVQSYNSEISNTLETLDQQTKTAMRIMDAADAGRNKAPEGKPTITGNVSLTKEDYQTLRRGFKAYRQANAAKGTLDALSAVLSDFKEAMDKTPQSYDEATKKALAALEGRVQDLTDKNKNLEEQNANLNKNVKQAREAAMTQKSKLDLFNPGAVACLLAMNKARSDYYAGRIDQHGPISNGSELQDAIMSGSPKEYMDAAAKYAHYYEGVKDFVNPDIIDPDFLKDGQRVLQDRQEAQERRERQQSRPQKPGWTGPEH